MSAMRVSRHAPACNVIKDDNGIITKVFVAGGWNTDAGYMKSTEIYDLSDDSWTDGPDFGSAIYESKMITAPSSSSYAAFIMTGLRDADRQKDIDKKSYFLPICARLAIYANSSPAFGLVE